MKTNVYVEFYGEQLSQNDIVAQAKKIWTDGGNNEADLNKIELYIKPEDDKIYYVFNGDITGAFDISGNANVI
ncbi:MAG: DUF6465 family protein [Eubacterium sp.]|nr:DUF6465 family protein [Eubacterium sp.]